MYLEKLSVAVAALCLSLLTGCEQPKPTSTPAAPAEQAAAAPKPEPPKCTDCIPVTPQNFPRAETDLYFSNFIKGAGGIGRFMHNRLPTPIDKQDVIRMNRDTLYSLAVFDLDAGPVTITLPDAGKRFRSVADL
jgi:Protein of unknown function (DUF1254)